MVSLSAYAASLLALASAVRAGFYTTYPVGSDAISSGQSIQIQWQPNADAPDLTNVQKYTLKFMTGGNLVQTTVATIGTFDVSQTTVPFTIPQTAPGMYFLMYTADDGSGSSWSTRFSVDGGTSWYPDGVATGEDPSDNSSSSGGGGGIGDPTSIGEEPSSTPSDTVPTDNSSDASTSESGNHGSSSDDPVPSSTKDDNNHNSNDGSDNGNGNGNSNGHGEDTSAKPTEHSQDGDSKEESSLGSDDGESEDDSSNETDSEDTDSSEEDESSEDSSDDESSDTSDAARYILSTAAVLLASVFII
ncbi:hypothetical protein H4R20_001766 [Coemansia guatemalensis]|uniref:Yeast cell wall synthesis Kre9/Knh1-like N-terminal domain-containing protein n=1 Tax=Coemansia guatemalensis TaxID=2761395 RepID=A0A9W8HWG7_9FUNG|nr:hypothetical protein H4R20_001766 [Coemansia guatemalensis]